MVLAVVQAAGGDGSLPVLGSAPTTGNLIVAAYFAGSGNGALATNSNGWTFLDHSTGANGIGLYYRYVQGGDGTTYATPQSYAFQAQDVEFVWEISGAGSTWSASFDQSECEEPASGSTSSTSTALVTAAANELALIAAAFTQTTSAFPAAPTVASGYTTDADATGGAILSSGRAAHQAFAGGSSSVQFTATWPFNSVHPALATLLLKPPSGPQSLSAALVGVGSLHASATGGHGAEDISAALGGVGTVTAHATGGTATFSISAALVGHATLSASPLAEAEISEGFVSALATEPADAQIAEAFVSALTHSQAQGGQIAEANVMALVYQGPCATQRCDCWKITRTDNVVFAFTSRDVDFTFNGVLYKHCASLSDTATESHAELGAGGSVELTGILSDDSITDADLYAGLFDDAYVEMWRVSYGPDGVDPVSPFRLAAGWIGQVSHGQASWSAEVVGPTDKLKQAGLVQIYTPGCRWIFGDSNCQVDVPALAIHGINVTGGRGRFAIFCDVHSPGGTAIWNQGKVVWTYGRNAGVTCQVETVDFASQVISLWDLAPFPPEPGDIFDLLPGCPKTKDACVTYANLINFGGFPDVPGPDALQQNADSLFTGANG